MSFISSILATPVFKFLAERLGEGSTITGIGGLVGVGVGLGLGTVTWPVAIPMLVAAGVAILLPQNPNKQVIVSAATAAVAIATGKAAQLP